MAILYCSELIFFRYFFNVCKRKSLHVILLSMQASGIYIENQCYKFTIKSFDDFLTLGAFANLSASASRYPKASMVTDPKF